LYRVVGMSRFLIRKSVRCQNLASCVQGMALRRLGADYEAQYGYRPWLVESFVDTEHFLGTSYRAANWVEIGKTQGRGRQDREHHSAESIKTIYVYELESDWRARMGVVAPLGLVALEIAQGLDGDEWAANEFGGAKLGDKRSNERLGDFARTLGAMPGRAFCGAAHGDLAAIKAYYRLIEKPDDSAVTMEAILAPHRLRTVQRMKAQSTVLCIQDGTDVNYSALVQCDGLGVIGSNQTGAQSGGLHLHSTGLGGAMHGAKPESQRRSSTLFCRTDRREEDLRMDQGTSRMQRVGSRAARYAPGLCDGSRGRLLRVVRRTTSKPPR
jgi:hypothetical protein